MSLAASALKFLDSYTQEDSAIFFGRDREIDELYARCFESDILLVYGVSGVGKTSLIQCGLSSRFEDTDWLPIQVRRSDNLLDSWSDQIRAQSITPPPRDASIEKLAQNIYLDEFKPLYFIFDQFEELFLFGTSEEQQQFFQKIKSIRESNLNAKFIIVCREEFLAQFSNGERIIPDLLTNRMRLEHLTAKQMAAVLNSILTVSGRPYEQSFIDEFERIILLDDERIDLSYFQVYLDHVLGKTSDEVVLSHEHVGGIEEMRRVIDHFVIEQLSSLSHPEAGKQLLKFMVSSKGTKISRGIDDFKEIQLGLSESEVSGLLEDLVNARILTVAANSQKFEMRHDSVAKCIFDMMSEQDSLRWEVEEFVRVAYRRNQLEGARLTGQDLNYIEPLLRGIVMTKEEREFIETAIAIREKKRRSRKRMQRVAVFISVPIMITGTLMLPIRELSKRRAEKAVERSELLANWVLENNTGQPIMNYLLAKKAHELNPSAISHRALIHAYRNRHLSFKTWPANTIINENDTILTMMRDSDSTVVQLTANGSKAFKAAWNLSETKGIGIYQPFGRILTGPVLRTESFRAQVIDEVATGFPSYSTLLDRHENGKGVLLENGDVFTFNSEGCLNFEGNVVIPDTEANLFFAIGGDTLHERSLKPLPVRQWVLFRRDQNVWGATSLVPSVPSGMGWSVRGDSGVTATFINPLREGVWRIYDFTSSFELPNLVYDVTSHDLERELDVFIGGTMKRLSEDGEHVLIQSNRNELDDDFGTSVYYFSNNSEWSLADRHFSRVETVHVSEEGDVIDSDDSGDGGWLLPNILSDHGNLIMSFSGDFMKFSSEHRMHISVDNEEGWQTISMNGLGFQEIEIDVNRARFGEMRTRESGNILAKSHFIENANSTIMATLNSFDDKASIWLLDSTYRPVGITTIPLPSQWTFIGKSKLRNSNFVLFDGHSIELQVENLPTSPPVAQSESCFIPEDCPNKMFEVRGEELLHYELSDDGWSLVEKSGIPPLDVDEDIEFIACDGALIQLSSQKAICKDATGEYHKINPFELLSPEVNDEDRFRYDWEHGFAFWAGTNSRFSYGCWSSKVHLLDFNSGTFVTKSIPAASTSVIRRANDLFFWQPDPKILLTVDLESGILDTLEYVVLEPHTLPKVGVDGDYMFVSFNSPNNSKNCYAKVYSLKTGELIDSLPRTYFSSKVGLKEISDNSTVGRWFLSRAGHVVLGKNGGQEYTYVPAFIDNRGKMTKYRPTAGMREFLAHHDLRINENTFNGLDKNHFTGSNSSMSFIFSQVEDGVIYVGDAPEELRILNDDFFVIETNSHLTLCAHSVRVIDKYFEETYGKVELPYNYMKRFGIGKSMDDFQD